MLLTEICLDLYHRQVTAGSCAELSQTLLPFTWLKIKRYATAWETDVATEDLVPIRTRKVRDFDKFWLLFVRALHKAGSAICPYSHILNSKPLCSFHTDLSLFLQIGKNCILLSSIVTKKWKNEHYQLLLSITCRKKMWMTICVYLWGDMRVWHSRLEPQSGPPDSE